MAYLLSFLATSLGAPELALRLLLSLLIGYPLLYVHHRYLRKKVPHLQHLFLISGGLFLAIFNYGSDCIHSVICIFSSWLLLKFIGGSMISVIISFIFQMGYLLIGYVMTVTDSYDFTWTMPHCVLTLRLIALSFDVYDGQKDKKELSKDQQKTALETTPSLLEIASHTYFPASFMVGPQFSMRRYLDFINDRLYPKDTPSPITSGLMRGCAGLIYLGIYQIASQYIPDSYFISEEYMTLSLWKKLFMMGIWGKITLYKYISCWLITEGACTLSGLSYSGVDESGHPQWKGCANVKLSLFETSTKFEYLIASFNMNTNAWVAQYIYKRLKFLNNKYISQLGALLFLALWHGFHSGYYVTFLLEFLVVFFEKDLGNTLSKYPGVVKTLETPPLKYLLAVIMKAYVIVFMGYCLSGFVLLKSSRWLGFYSSVYYIGHVFFGGWLLYKPLIKFLLKKTSNQKRPHYELSSKTD